MSNTSFMIRTVVLAIAGSVLVFLLVGLMLADSWQVKTTRTIPAAPAVVAAKVTDLSEWPHWCALDFQLGNPTERSVVGAKGTTEQVATWTGPLGVATVKLTRVDPSAVDYLIGYKYGPDEQSFGGKFTGTIEWTASAEAGSGGSAVTWVENGELTNLVQRWSNWFGALQDKVQQVQRSSLAGLEENIRRGNDNSPKVGAPK